MQLSIVIVSYNVKYFLEQCLSSVKLAINNIQAEVIVIDNCSTDSTIEYLEPKFSFAKFIKNKENFGFGKANNLALKLCKGEYVLFLNPDTILPENILKECLYFFQSNNNAGAIGVQMLDGSGSFLAESKRAFPSPFVSFCKLTGLSALFPRSGVFNKYALGSLDKTEIHEVDVLSGAFLMARKNLLQQLNGFDETFFMYGEDIDLSYRLQQTGFKNYYLGNLKIIHFKGESIGAEKIKHARSFYNAMFVFVNKYYKGFGNFFLKFFLRIGIFIRSGISFFALPFKSFKKKANGLHLEKICLIGDIASTADAEKIIRQFCSKDTHIEKKDSLHGETSSTIIFCTGELTFTETINIISNHSIKHNYMWHAPNTGSIVGSVDKNESGVVYAMEETLLQNAE